MKGKLVILGLTILVLLPMYLFIHNTKSICNMGNKQMCLNSMTRDVIKRENPTYSCRYIAKLGLYCGKDKNELIKRDKFTNKY